MTMKPFIFQSNGIGVNPSDIIKCLVLLIFVLLLPINPACNALGEEETLIVSDYQFDDFLSFFEVCPETKPMDAIEHSIIVTSLSETEITEQALFDRFPNYITIREQFPNNESNGKKYVVYSLSDESRLFIFIEKGKLEGVYRMVPLCDADAFAHIMPGISSPEDVIRIDGNSSFNPFIQWGPVSFHCLDDGTFRQVTYKQCRLILTRYVVMDIVTISQDACLTIYRDIYAEDMPRGRD